MKKLILLTFLICNISYAFAQTTDTNKPVKTRLVNGTGMSSANDILKNLSSSPEFATLVSAIKAAALEDTFKDNNAITFFAPTNQAFEKLAPGELDSLMQPAHKAELINLLECHIIQGKITSKDINAQIKAGNGQATFKTLSGGTLIASINANRNIMLTDENGDQSVVSSFDIQQSDGILHIVNAVLIPKSKP